MPDANVPDPARIFQMINAYQVSSALSGAIDLGLFTALGGEAKSAATLAADIGAAEKGVRVLCDFLTVHGLLEKNDDVYLNAPDAAMFLDQQSPAYFGTVAKFMTASDVSEGFADVGGVVRNGGTLLEGSGTVEPNNPIWVDFARSMVPLMIPSGMFIADLLAQEGDLDAPIKVLDIAAGHGMFGILIAQKFANAEIVALDWPEVLDIATDNAERAGVADRHSRIEGSAFEVDLGDGYDVVLLTNFLHHFSVDTCTDLLRKAHASLNPDGKAVTLEFVPNDDRVTPPDQATFAMIMLATTAEGDAYTFAELESMAAAAGFSSSEMHRPPGPPQTVVVSTK